MTGFLRTVWLIFISNVVLLLAGHALGGIAGVAVALVISGVMYFIFFWKIDRIVLRKNCAIKVNAVNCPDLYSVVKNLALRADLPAPSVYLIDQALPNAFALGLGSCASVAVTTGLLRCLDREEVAAVISHELAHILNHDTFIATITAVLAASVLRLEVFFSPIVQRSAIGSAGMIPEPFSTAFIKMTLNRNREYLANELGARVCGDPAALASALRKISQKIRDIKNPIVRSNPAMAYMFISGLLQGSCKGALSIHPDIETRIELLDKMASQSEFSYNLSIVKSSSLYWFFGLWNRKLVAIKTMYSNNVRQ